MRTATTLALLAVALSRSGAAAEVSTVRTWTVEGVTREAMLFLPETAKTTAAPVVFVFHGHGGGMRQVARSMAIQKYWPEAIVVCMQGLNTPGQLTDREGKRPGWQASADSEGGRDLKFFDAVLASLKADYKVDESRIYATGHSNGGGFTYLLWAERGDVFAAVAPSSAVAARSMPKLKPKPVLHVAGEKDPLVKFQWQTRSIDALRERNKTEAAGQPWGRYATLYPSPDGNPVVAYIHPGGHQFPPEAPAAIVKFFKEHPGPGRGPKAEPSGKSG